MRNVNDGGPAFPTLESADGQGHKGMSLLDYFATQALLAENVIYRHEAKDIAKAAYNIAEAMLEEKNLRAAEWYDPYQQVDHNF